jgi:hypothetical protein
MELSQAVPWPGEQVDLMKQLLKLGIRDALL